MLRLKYQEIFVLILENKLTQEWILLLLLEVSLKLLKICVASIGQYSQFSISPVLSFRRTEDEVSKSEVRI